MNQHSPSPAVQTAPSTRFFRIAVGLLATWLLCGVAAAAFLFGQAESINRSGGWGWIWAMGFFAALTVPICLGCAICTAVSLYRREAHRRASLVILFGSVLLLLPLGSNIVRAVGRFRDRPAEEARVAKTPVPQRADAIARSPIPESLVLHFRDQEILLRPEHGFPGRDTTWIIENAGVGPQCQVVVSFVQFRTTASIQEIRRALMEVSVPSLINEHARMAMFLPYARGKIPGKRSCEAWPAQSKRVVEQAGEAFSSYRSAASGDRRNEN